MIPLNDRGLHIPGIPNALGRVDFQQKEAADDEEDDQGEHCRSVRTCHLIDHTEEQRAEPRRTPIDRVIKAEELGFLALGMNSEKYDRDNA